MKTRFLIISLLLTIVLTGCNAKYSLTIENEKITEELSIIENNSNNLDIKDETGKSFYDYAKLYGEEQDINIDYNGYHSQNECTNNCVYYDKKYINEDGKVGFKLSHEFDFSEMTFSTIANELIPAFSVQYSGKVLKISGKSPKNYFNDYEVLNDIELNINTNYKVLSTKKKKKDDGKYIWEISKDDKSSKEELYITLDTQTVLDKVEKKNINPVILLIALGCFLIFIIGFIITTRRN